MSRFHTLCVYTSEQGRQTILLGGMHQSLERQKPNNFLPQPVGWQSKGRVFGSCNVLLAVSQPTTNRYAIYVLIAHPKWRRERELQGSTNPFSSPHFLRLGSASEEGARKIPGALFYFLQLRRYSINCNCWVSGSQISILELVLPLLCFLLVKGCSFLLPDNS